MGTTMAQRYVVVVLVLLGISDIVYADYVPVWPFSDTPVPAASWALGLASFVAAFGVLRRVTWGRWLAVAIAVVTLVFMVVGDFYYGLRGATIEEWLRGWGWLAPVFWVVVMGIALWFLVSRWPFVRRWPVQGTADPPSERG